MMRSKSPENSQPSAWKTVPRWAIVLFLVAVFCIFASFGFVFDGMGMERQSALCLAFSVVIIALFATCYAVSGITLEMQPGDHLTLITDGVVEARDAQGALFGFDRARALMRQNASPLVLAEAAIHHGQDDDLTVISILRTA